MRLSVALPFAGIKIGRLEAVTLKVTRNGPQGATPAGQAPIPTTLTKVMLSERAHWSGYCGQCSEREIEKVFPWLTLAPIETPTWLKF